MVPYSDVPVIVNSYNRYAPLRKLIDWLRAAGYRDVVVLDNASSFRPLIGYLDTLEKTAGVRVVHLGENHGHTALWDADILGELGIDTEFVYTDPDVVPAPSCPPDVVRVLQTLLLHEPAVFKAGLGLRLDDIPRLYRHRRAVLAWETKYWLRPAAPGLFVAPIDTTFALYRPMSERGVDELAIRTGPPFVASHESWYSSGLLVRREDRHYARVAARTGTSTWSRVHLPPWLRRWERSFEEIYPLVVLVDRPGERLPGYRSLEDVLTGHPPSLGLEDGVADGIYLPRGTARLREEGISFDELRRVAKVGARLVVRHALDATTACGPEPDSAPSSLDAWLLELSREVIDGTPPSRHVDSWELERVQLVRAGAGMDRAPTDRHRRRAVSPDSPDEVVVHLKARGQQASSSAPVEEPGPVAEITQSRLDLHARFARVGHAYLGEGVGS